MSPLERALGTWLATLVDAADPKSGWSAAKSVVGDTRAQSWCAEMAKAGYDDVMREQLAAFDVCRVMAWADGDLDPAERELLERLLDQTAVDDDARVPLAAAIGVKPHEGLLDDLGARVMHPVLRELLLGLSWRMATADGAIDAKEQSFHDKLAEGLGVSVERVGEIRSAAIR